MQNIQLKKAIDKIFEEPTPARFSIELTLTSEDDPDWSYIPTFVDTLTIEQDFNNICDMLTVKVPLSPTGMDQICTNNRRDTLIAYVKFTQLGNNIDKPISGISPIIRPYRAMSVSGDIDTTLTLSMIDLDFYKIRQTRVNSIFTNTNIENVIRTTAVALGITRLELVPPDNTATYNHVIIPPALGIQEVFDYLQENYGIYGKGMSCYFYDGILYIKPAYAYENDKDVPIAHLYETESGEYIDTAWSHKYTDADIHIKVNNESDTVYVNREGAENNRTDYVVLRSSHLVDGYSTTIGNEHSFNPNAVYRLGDTKAKTVLDKHRNIKYAPPTDNIYKLTSQFASRQAEIKFPIWYNPIPWKLIPLQKVMYYSCDTDFPQVMDIETGVLESIGYSFKRVSMGEVSNMYTYESVGMMRVRLIDEGGA